MKYLFWKHLSQGLISADMETSYQPGKTTKWGLASVKFLLKDNLKNEPSYGVVKVNSEERKQTMRCEESVR